MTTNRIYGIHWGAAFGLPFAVLVALILLCAVGVSPAQTNAPPLPRYFPAPDSADGIEFAKQMADVESVVQAIMWSKGVTNSVQLKTRDFPPPTKPHVKGIYGYMRPRKEPTQPYYRMKVWNELTQDYIEFRAYVPGNTGFFQGELVTE